MVKGALFTIGILTTLGGFGFAVLMIMGAAMSDNPSASADTVSEAALPAIIGGVGIAMIIGAFFVP